MSKKIFTKEEIEILRQNKYVKSVSSKGITYTDELKHYAIEQSENGVAATKIFELAEFDIKILGRTRVDNSVFRWKKAYKKSGIMGLRDTRKNFSGRPLKRKISLEEQLERKESKIKFLEMELEFQKKLDMIERRAIIKETKGKKE